MRKDTQQCFLAISHIHPPLMLLPYRRMERQKVSNFFISTQSIYIHFPFVYPFISIIYPFLYNPITFYQILRKFAPKKGRAPANGTLPLSFSYD